MYSFGTKNCYKNGKNPYKILSNILLSRMAPYANEKVGVPEIHRNKPWFNQECSELADKRKQAKLFWLQNPNDQTESKRGIRFIRLRIGIIGELL